MTVTLPGGAEWLIILAMFAIPLLAIAGIVVLLRRGGGGAGPPADQRPPDGYWWDGAKWNPPAR